MMPAVIIWPLDPPLLPPPMPTSASMPGYAPPDSQRQADAAIRSSLGAANPESAVPSTLEQAEIELIRAALVLAGGNISAASKQLGISRNTIYRKLHWNLPQPD